jgi:hypothetical protein
LWESAVRPITRSISVNIKPKRKVAALFKPGVTAWVQSPGACACG